MSVQHIESFTWVTGSVAGRTALNTRYNIAGGGALNYNISVGGGRFAGNALALSGDGWIPNYPKGSIGPDIIIGIAVKWTGSTLGGAGNEIISIFELSSAQQNEQVSIRFDGLGHLRIQRQGTTLATGIQVMQSNTWYYIEFRVHLDNAAGSAQIIINGVLDAAVAGVNTAPQATPTSASCKINNTATPFYCDWYLKNDLTALGPQRVSLKLPTADGSDQDWAPSAGGTQFNLVNSVPPDADANGFIESNTPGNNSTFDFGPLPYVPAVVNGVQVSLYSRFDDAGPHLVAPVVISGATTDVGTPQPIAASYLDFYLQFYALDPDTGVAWLAAAVDAAEYGVNLDT